MISLQVVFLFTPEIHLVSSSTITGTSACSSFLTDNWWVELDKGFWCLSFPSSFLDKDLLLEFSFEPLGDLLLELSFGTFGNVLCLDLWLWWYVLLLLSTSMITFIMWLTMDTIRCHAIQADWTDPGTDLIRWITSASFVISFNILKLGQKIVCQWFDILITGRMF